MIDLSNTTPPLRFREGTEYIWLELDKVLRTGWVDWGIPNPETVAEHILSARQLAVQHRDDIYLNENDFDDLLAIIEVHDWPEITVGDLVILVDDTEASEKRASKEDVEMSAMIKICSSIVEGEIAMNLYERYVSEADTVARHAKQLEKMQAVILARMYEDQFAKPGLTAEFIKNTRYQIDLPFLTAELDEIERSVVGA